MRIVYSNEMKQDPNPAASELILDWEDRREEAERTRAAVGLLGRRQSGAQPRPPTGFRAFCAARLTLLAPQYVLHTVYGGTKTWLVPLTVI